MKKSDIFWQTYLNLEKEMIEVSKFVTVTDVKTVYREGQIIAEPCKTQLEVFSSHIADLLVRCCVEIEAISKELYFDNGGTKKRGDISIFFDEDCLKLIDKKWKTSKKNVEVVAPFFNLTMEENRTLRPLKEAHKRRGTYWEKAYQAVKHDRYSSLSQGNVKALLHSLSALFLLNLYYRNDSWFVKLSDVDNQNYSMGSSIFAVQPPTVGMLWYGNNPIKSTSPYVASYREDAYQYIEKLQNEEHQALNNYLSEQLELKEEDFLSYWRASVEEFKNYPILWSLAKYRLHKRIPDTLPFEKMKKLLIESQEWNGQCYQRNKHLSPDELTPENIQSEMDKVGICKGMEMESMFRKGEWELIAHNNEICRIHIPDAT